MERIATVRDVRVPTFIYGTAWKEERTEELVAEALEAGFRGFDTANQRRHYREAAVGRALTRAVEDGTVDRGDLFVQTKFTHPQGQGGNAPYDTDAPPAEQVRQSFRSSLDHLEVDRVDSYLLHAPTARSGLADADREAWRAMEELHEEGRARLVGVSNVTPGQLRTLSDFARVKPAFVQNRCRLGLGWDVGVREVCEDRGIGYQGFSLLTANRPALNHRDVKEIARRHGRSVEQVIFRFAMALGIVPLTGTTDPDHMREDLAVYEFDLTEEEVRAVEAVGG